MYPGHLWLAHTDAARRALRDLVEAQGLRIMSLNTPNIDLNITAAGEKMRRQALGLMHGILELAGDLDVAGAPPSARLIQRSTGAVGSGCATSSPTGIVAATRR